MSVFKMCITVSACSLFHCIGGHSHAVLQRVYEVTLLANNSPYYYAENEAYGQAVIYTCYAKSWSTKKLHLVRISYMTNRRRVMVKFSVKGYGKYTLRFHRDKKGNVIRHGCGIGRR
jgi:hypothetical protein